ncbi:MAG: 4-cresol dehydrogenase (hydroxylating) flavoprotein subunit [Methyloprofundus sp.]|nr:MAG: 4-cresol dehydrogenase (hydroxylating) flavoprotein subunit [Methyloprofundus sp.]
MPSKSIFYCLITAIILKNFNYPNKNNMQESVKEALSAWSTLLNNKIQINPELKSCIAVKKSVIATLFPASVKDIIECVKIADTYKIPIYTVSTGHNWGYGSSLPVEENCIILNLSNMNKIISFDAKTGVITIEPGVTQHQLATFLDKHQHPYLIPVTGAGPDCSIVGNAIERGYGITPYADHFASVLSLEAILADGSLYQSMLSKLGSQNIDTLHKWGMGPYLDGLFTQGNLGIVTQMSIALAPTPSSVKAFFFSVKKADDLEEIVICIQRIIKELNGVLGSINVMNQHRVLSMTEPYPDADQLINGLISTAAITKMARKRQVFPWTCVGALYGNKAVVNAAQKEIKKILGWKAKRLIFFTPKTVSRINSITQSTPFIKYNMIGETVTTLHKTMQLFAGRPSEIALPLAYWLTNNQPPQGTAMRPDQDDCGLIWYSPLVPMQAEKVTEFTTMVTSICIKHQIEPLITLTSFSDRSFDSTIPILFKKDDPDAVLRAHACYEELFETGKKLGFLPYRLSIHSMSKLDKYAAIPDLLKCIKKAIDPNNILAPGRYLPK